MSSVVGLRCVTCGREFRPGEVFYTCPVCGPLLGTLDVVYDFSAVKKQLSRGKLARNARPDHWRYLPLLPVEQPEWIPDLQVGWTPLYRAEDLAKELGIQALWIKDDGRNPTASLKDRASSVALVKARERRAHTVTAASTGNAASSWSAFSALAGLCCIIFVPRGAPQAKIAQLLLYGATVLEVDGNYDEAFDLCSRAAERWGWFNRSTAVNPYLGEGKKTAALELCEQLDWRVPDAVFVAVGDGCIFQGLWKGFKELYDLGWTDRLPRMIGVQAAGAAPLVRAWQRGERRVSEPVQPRTIADSIAVGVPRDQVKALRAARESGGEFLAVSDEEILQAMRVLARRVGVLAEPAGAAGLAGLLRLAREERLHAIRRVAVLVTGHGLKDVGGLMRAVNSRPLSVENSLRKVEMRLKEQGIL